MSQNIEGKKFTCNICEKIFSSEQKQNQHIKTVHGEENFFECNVCIRSFKWKKTLIIHVENNHQGKHHDCKSCGKVFARYESLTNHIKNVHERKRNYKCNYLSLIHI